MRLPWSHGTVHHHAWVAGCLAMYSANAAGSQFSSAPNSEGAGKEGGTQLPKVSRFDAFGVAPNRTRHVARLCVCVNNSTPTTRTLLTLDNVKRVPPASEVGGVWKEVEDLNRLVDSRA